MLCPLIGLHCYNSLQGVVDVHEMLFKTVEYVSRGVEIGIFTPMPLLVGNSQRQHNDLHVGLPDL